MKRKHAGAQSRKHGCRRCGEHARKVVTVKRKSGSLYTLCVKCAKAVGTK